MQSHFRDSQQIVTTDHSANGSVAETVNTSVEIRQTSDIEDRFLRLVEKHAEELILQGSFNFTNAMQIAASVCIGQSSSASDMHLRAANTPCGVKY